MSTDRFAEMFNYLSMISRDVGEFRVEVKTNFSEVNACLDRIEREQRLQGQRLDRIEGLLLTTRADEGELQDRMGVLESKRT